MLTALPVAVEVRRALAGAVVGHVEGALGWQVTDGTDLPPAVRLADVHAGTGGGGCPTVLLVAADDEAVAVARAARGVDGVLAWPDEQARLPGVVAGLATRDTPADDPTTLRVGGAAGGVGTTTVALALGGLVAWSGRPVLVVACGDVPVAGVPTLASEALAGHRTWDAARAVPGVDGLRVVAAPPGPRGGVRAPRGTVVVRDVGVAEDVDLLVCRRDRAGATATARTAAGAVVVVGAGPVPEPAWRRATAATPRQLAVTHDVRVARAGVLERVPTSLPGRWLRPLRPLADQLADA